jgi:hypothetical protein
MNRAAASESQLAHLILVDTVHLSRVSVGEEGEGESVGGSCSQIDKDGVPDVSSDPSSLGRETPWLASPACIAREWSSSESGARVVSIEVYHTQGQNIGRKGELRSVLLCLLLARHAPTHLERLERGLELGHLLLHRRVLRVLLGVRVLFGRSTTSSEAGGRRGGERPARQRGGGRGETGRSSQDR